MSRQQFEGKPPRVPEPSENSTADVARSGSGADTAMIAMLKKRRMRASRDADPQAPKTGSKKPFGE